MYTLYIGNKNYSSWSLRAWVLMKAFGIPFREQRITLYEPGFPRADPRPFAVGQGAVPARRRTIVWDSLAIAEYLAERHPGHVARRRRCARMGALRRRAEMHSGFARCATNSG